MELLWHPYRYYPYERELARREISALLSPDTISESKNGVLVEGRFDQSAVARLVYFAESIDGERVSPVLQARLERASGTGTGRQSTRYSVHGLHEYKGKFNPQIARVLLNILQVPKDGRVLDPFCGSGTSLVECAHAGIKAVGVDINPLAVFVANAKLRALQLASGVLKEQLGKTLSRYRLARAKPEPLADARALYLAGWFTPEILRELEALREAIMQGPPECQPVLLSVASNLLRDYSLQDPIDLRIRRRKTPLPTLPFIEAFTQAANLFFAKQADAQLALMHTPPESRALLSDIRTLKPGPKGVGTAKFDCALTSPPYATALPYIDTQRLSLVWLGLLSPAALQSLEARLVGSREVRGESKKVLIAELLQNTQALPDEQLAYCRLLHSALTPKDGFRRQAVPFLLYRYFAHMAEALRSVRRCMKDKAPFALIVGSNHTVLSGQRFDIDTPRHLAELARFCGWTHQESVPLQTYQRYGYHMNNAVNAESLIILRAA